MKRDNKDRSPSSACLTEVVRHLRGDISPEAVLDFVGDSNGNLRLDEYFRVYPERASNLGRWLNTKLLVVKSHRDFTKPAKLIFDGRYLDGLGEESPETILLLSSDGQTARYLSSAKELPSLKVNCRWSGPLAYRPLWKLVGSGIEFKTPPTLAELKQHFTRHPPPADTRIRVSIICLTGKGKFYYATQVWFGDPAATQTLLLRARPGDRYSLVYGPVPEPRRQLKRKADPDSQTEEVTLPSKKGRNDQAAFDLPDPGGSNVAWPVGLKLRLESLRAIKEQGLLPDHQINRCLQQIGDLHVRLQSGAKSPQEVTASSSVAKPPTALGKERVPVDPESALARNRCTAARLQRHGLNLAFDLGIASGSQWEQASKSLGSTAGVLACGYDEAGQLKLLAYVDRNFSSVLQVVSSADGHCWNEDAARFFGAIEERRQALSEQRRIVLKPFTDALDRFTRPGHQRSRFDCCKEELLRVTRKQQLVTFCRTDRDLQNLKYFFGLFVTRKSQKGLCRVNLQVDARNELAAMDTPDYHLFNARHYADFTKKEAFNRAANSLQSTSARPATPDTCLAFCGLLWSSWTDLGTVFSDMFGFDIHSSGAKTLSSLSHQALWSKTRREAGSMVQGIEKLKPFYSKSIRNFCKGGVTFSAQCALKCGGPIDDERPLGPQASMLTELDLVSSYGFSAASTLLPNGFCVGYVSPAFERRFDPRSSSGLPPRNNPEGLLFRRDSLRSSSFEFRATYYTLWKLETGKDRKPIRKVFSNYHPEGVFNVGKCILDLAVVFDDGTLALYNFDSAWTHGCPSCQPLDRYVNGSSGEELIRRSAKRDSAIRSWLQACGSDESSYTVLTDCHHAEYSPANLRRVFKREQALGRLVQNVPKADELSSAKLLDWLRKRIDDTSFTYLAFLRGSAGEPVEVTPLCLPSAQTQRGNDLGRSTAADPVMVTREYLEYLLRECQFQVSSVEAVLFFSVDRSTSRTFDWLVRERRRTDDPVLTGLLKSVANFAVGYFGLNEIKARPRYIMTNSLPQRFDHRKHQAIDLPDCQGRLLAYRLAPRGDNGNREERRNNALPMHAAVIENGKLRLIRFLNFLQSNLLPGTFRFLYSNVDNVILALSDRGLSHLVPPHRRAQFARGLESFFSDDESPGSFVPKWIVAGGDFKFATAKIQNYALVVSDGRDRFKCSGVNGVTATEGYEFTMNLLTTSAGNVEQVRRRHKPTSLDTEAVALVHRIKETSL